MPICSNLAFVASEDQVEINQIENVQIAKRSRGRPKKVLAVIDAMFFVSSGTEIIEFLQIRVLKIFFAANLW